MKIGAHMSAAGGVVRAVERAVLHGCEALQVFTKNNARWQSKPIASDAAQAFRAAMAGSGIAPAVSHASYLINLAAPAGPLRDKSIDALVDELDRADLLGLLGVVFHPGARAADATEADALALIAGGIRTVLDRRPGAAPLLIVEHTAGHGRALGHRFEHLATIVDRLDGSPRVGVCLDTCHLVAAGYDITSESGYARTFHEFGLLVGLDRLRMLHANDSKRPLGSRIDRHEDIGKGFVGLDAFRRLLHDPKLAHLAMVLETRKTPGVCDDPRSARRDPLDEANLNALRALRDGAAPARKKRRPLLAAIRKKTR